MPSRGLFLLLLVVAVRAAPFHVDPTTQHIIDEFGRTRLFHGLNAVYKIPPWHPELEGFDAQNSFSEIDAQNLVSWGFNHVRLGVMWPGVQPTSTTTDTEYLNTMGRMIDLLHSYNISTLVDCHQDILSRKLCGEGAPDWAISTTNGLAFSHPSAHKFTVDPVTQYPDLKDCLSHPFFVYYMSDQACLASQHLYNNTGILQDKFVEYWSSVVAALKGHEGVMGYELLNEPWPGDIYTNPLLIGLSGYADKHNLVPMYRRLHEAIRRIDTDHMIFFEPAVTDYWTSGFQEGPGGKEYNDRQVYSYHIYCSLDTNRTDPRSKTVCKGEDSESWATRKKDIKRLGCGSFLTEFGASTDHSIAIHELNYMGNQADKYMENWDYWQFKYFQDLTTADALEGFYDSNGNLEVSKVRALSRTFAPAIAGVPVSMAFDPETALYNLKYNPNPAAKGPTEIYLNEAWYYPHGFDVTITPPGAAQWAKVATNRIEVTHTAASRGTTVQITITPVAAAATV
ncbi:putative Glycoside hydrolase [Paratrimastix pyriformis]|uniref:Glycoside hydrolase n=1 Tax=Paratrimastix pyriformis TaxID=342808 RepID=A0ABQ8US91_9EUKA|nr:putative Glycoside hydrolase [Paratrimastix pyriformis]